MALTDAEQVIDTLPCNQLMNYLNGINVMSARKTDISIAIKIGDKSFSIHGMKMLDQGYKIKRGRSWSTKLERATISQIFELSRKWAVNNV